MIKISSPVQGICSGRYIGPTKLIFVIIKFNPVLKTIKTSVPLNINKNGKQRASY
jgi:hypothetical protein